MTTNRSRKLSRRDFTALLLGAFGMAPGTPAMADSGAEGYVGKIAGEVMALANSGGSGNALRNRFASLLNRYISLQNIANFALGPYQKQLPAGDKAVIFGVPSFIPLRTIADWLND